MAWGIQLPPDRPLLMAILNVTPDSFSDGGLYDTPEAAIEAGRRMADEGADLIDVGGESTRPGAQPVSAEEEIDRTAPVVEALTDLGIRVSIDTSKAEVARAALELGAALVNDVTAFSDPEMAGVCFQAQCEVCLMHMKGTPRDMQHKAEYEDVVREVRTYLLERAAVAQASGIAHSQIWIDPGLGFGKTDVHNLQLLKEIPALVSTGYPVLIGISRKSSIGRILARDGHPLPAEDRLEGTLAAQVVAQIKGAKAIRAHDVKAARRAIDMTAAILSAGASKGP